MLCPTCSEIKRKPIRLTSTGEKEYELIIFEKKECSECDLKYSVEILRKPLNPEEIQKLGLEV